MVERPEVTISGVWDDGSATLKDFFLRAAAERPMTLYPHGHWWFLPYVEGSVTMGRGVVTEPRPGYFTYDVPMTVSDDRVVYPPGRWATLLRWLWFHPTGFRRVWLGLDRIRAHRVE